MAALLLTILPKNPGRRNPVFVPARGGGDCVFSSRVPVDWVQRALVDWVQRALVDWVHRALVDWVHRALVDWVHRALLDWVLACWLFASG